MPPCHHMMTPTGTPTKQTIGRNNHAFQQRSKEADTIVNETIHVIKDDIHLPTAHPGQHPHPAQSA